MQNRQSLICLNQIHPSCGHFQMLQIITRTCCVVWYRIAPFVSPAVLLTVSVTGSLHTPDWRVNSQSIMIGCHHFYMTGNNYHCFRTIFSGYSKFICHSECFPQIFLAALHMIPICCHFLFVCFDDFWTDFDVFCVFCVGKTTCGGSDRAAVFICLLLHIS